MPADRQISALHATLRFHHNRWWLSDAGSATGTFVLVEDAGRPVHVGDVYRIARTELQVFAIPHGYDKPWFGTVIV